MTSGITHICFFSLFSLGSPTSRYSCKLRALFRSRVQHSGNGVLLRVGQIVRSYTCSSESIRKDCNSIKYHFVGSGQQQTAAAYRSEYNYATKVRSRDFTHKPSKNKVPEGSEAMTFGRRNNGMFICCATLLFYGMVRVTLRCASVCTSRHLKPDDSYTETALAPEARCDHGRRRPWEKSRGESKLVHFKQSAHGEAGPVSTYLSAEAPTVFTVWPTLNLRCVPVCTGRHLKPHY